MHRSRVLSVLLGIFVVAGCFAAGYLLSRGDGAPPMEAATTATQAASASAPLPRSPEGPAASAAATAPRLVIRRAVYGDLPDGQSADVTGKVREAVDAGGLTIAASNDNFGDPAENIAKKLRVDYTLDGIARSRTVAENDTLAIKLSAGPPRLVIRKAVYGDLPDGKSADVTSKVEEQAQAARLTIEATNDNFGDPAEGIVKKLRVEYTFDGKPGTRTVGEGETLTIEGTP